MPYIKVYIHFVWSTKNRIPFLDNHILRQTVWQHIRENAREKNIYLDFIGGYSDHCHCLISLGLDQSIKQMAQLIKGESSHWINQNKLCKSKFQWQNDYFVASVSESHMSKTREYIRNQEVHHRAKLYSEEINDLLLKHGFERKGE